MPTQSRTYRRCVSYCTASSYDLAGLATCFKRKNYYMRLSRDVLHVSSLTKNADLFFFSHGTFVAWGWEKRKEKKWIELSQQYCKMPLASPGIDYFAYCMGEIISIDMHERFKLDVITLESEDAQIKLAMSYGLAQSIKLEAFEDAIQDAIRINASLPEEIAKYGAISLSRRSIFKRIGEIFMVRSLINLNSEYLDTPEFFWRNPDLEPFYITTKKFLDIPVRVSALNQKLDVLQELLHILNSQLQHRHSSMLESIIIILILIEIAISLFLKV